MGIKKKKKEKIARKSSLAGGKGHSLDRMNGFESSSLVLPACNKPSLQHRMCKGRQKFSSIRKREAGLDLKRVRRTAGLGSIQKIGISVYLEK